MALAQVLCFDASLLLTKTGNQGKGTKGKIFDLGWNYADLYKKVRPLINELRNGQETTCDWKRPHTVYYHDPFEQ